jgi:hypothetical protein
MIFMKHKSPILAALIVFAASIVLNVSGAFAQLSDNFPEGSLWHAQGDSRIYVIANGHKRHIPNEAVFSSYGWQMSQVQEADPDILFSIPDVRVIKTADSSSVYDIMSDKRLLIKSAEDFESEGFTWDEVSVVNRAELESYPLETESATQYEPSTTSAPATAATSAEPLILQKIDEAKTLLANADPVYAQSKKVAAARTLAKGSSGADVEAVQTKLRQLGFFPKNTEANGNFGPATEKAVKLYQKARKISALGSVGPQTIAALAKDGLVLGKSGAISHWRETVPVNREVLLAAWNEGAGDMQPVSVTLESHKVKVGKKYQTVYKVITHTPGFTVHYKSGTGVNTQYAVTSPAGYTVLANRFPIFDAVAGKIGTFPPQEEVYVPYNNDLRTPEVVEAGRVYLDGVVDKAMQDLRTKGIMSATGRGLVADLTDPDELKNIAIIEHMDYAEFHASEDKAGVVNKIFTILALNKGDTFKFSGSTKGALGLAQFIKGTYNLIVKQFPAAGLIPSFTDGMANHVNAIKAMALYHDVSGATLESVVREKITQVPEDLDYAMEEVRAAAYNGGAGRVKLALAKFGANWDDASSARYGLRTETKTYLEKFRVVREILTQ